MKKGLTLIEMIVVISIIGIISGMIVPSVSKYLPGIQLNGTARTLTSNLREVQEKAVTQQDQHLIRFLPVDGPYTSYQLARIYYPPEEIIEHEEVIKQVDLPNGITISLDPTITDGKIIFSADGGPTTNGNITISNSQTQKIINVSPAGFIKIL